MFAKWLPSGKVGEQSSTLMVRCLIESEPKTSTTNTSTRPKYEGFTLIELLVVISIIAILAGISFPAVQGAMGSGKKAKARNDVSQLVAAVKAFQLEYGRLPCSSEGASGDVIATTNNKVVIAALTISNDLNPRGIVFFEPKQAKGGKGGISDGIYFDPWGKPYTFSFDTDYNNRLTVNGVTLFNTVIVESGGPDGLLSATNDNISNLK